MSKFPSPVLALALTLAVTGPVFAAETEASLVKQVMATKSLPSEGRWIYVHGNKAASVYLQLPVVRTKDRAAAITFKSLAEPIDVNGRDVYEIMFVQAANCRANMLQYLVTAGFDEEGDVVIASEDQDPPEVAKADLAKATVETLCDTALKVDEDYVMTLDDVRDDASLEFLSDAVDSWAPKPTPKP